MSYSSASVFWKRGIPPKLWGTCDRCGDSTVPIKRLELKRKTFAILCKECFNELIVFLKGAYLYPLKADEWDIILRSRVHAPTQESSSA